MQSNPKPIVTALLSYGMSGEVFHAPLLSAHPGFLLKTVWQRNGDRARNHYPHVQIERTLEGILNDPEIELVIVNTPNESHFPYASRSLEAGKHVVVEKPFTNTVAEGKALIDLARKKGVKLSVFQNRRWDGDFMTTKKVIGSGMLGKVVEFEGHYDRYRNYIEPNTWKEAPGPGSGILYNLGSHLIDQVLTLFGFPQGVDARIGIQRPGGMVDDFYDIRFSYEGLQVILKSSYLVCEQGPRFIVHGTQGSWLKWGIDPQEQALKDKVVPGGKGWGAEAPGFYGKVNAHWEGLHVVGQVETLPGNYLQFYQNIHEAIRLGVELEVKPEQSLDVIRLIEACIQSNHERKMVCPAP